MRTGGAVYYRLCFQSANISKMRFWFTYSAIGNVDLRAVPLKTNAIDMLTIVYTNGGTVVKPDHVVFPGTKCQFGVCFGSELTDQSPT